MLILYQGILWVFHIEEGYEIISSTIDPLGHEGEWPDLFRTKCTLSKEYLLPQYMKVYLTKDSTMTIYRHSTKFE